MSNEWDDVLTPQERTAMNKNFIATADVYELRKHAQNGKSPFHDEAVARLRQVENSAAYKEEQRLENLPLEELEAEFNQKMQPIRQAAHAEQASRNGLIFLRDTNDYVPCQNNQQLMEAYLHSHQLRPTVDNLRLAWAEVKRTPFAVVEPGTNLPPNINEQPLELWEEIHREYTEGDDALRSL